MVTLKLCLVFTLTFFCLLLSAFLFMKDYGKSSNRWLILTFASLGVVNAIETVFYFPEVKNSASQILKFLFYNKETFELLVMPSLALFIIQNYSIRKNTLWYFLPALLSFATTTSYLLYSGSITRALPPGCYRELWSDDINYIFLTIEVMQVVYYGHQIGSLLKSHGDARSGNRMFTVFLIVGSARIFYLIDFVLALQYTEHLILRAYLFSCYKFILIASAISLFYLEIKKLIELSVTKEVKAKYQASPLTDLDKKRILSMVETYMSKNKPYLNPEFTLEKIAKDTGLLRAHLSQSINELSKMNFREYINCYRIQESILMMKLDPVSNINQLYYEAGFNSKSVFNTAFKKYTGLTPTAYRKDIYSQAQVSMASIS